MIMTNAEERVLFAKFPEDLDNDVAFLVWPMWWWEYLFEIFTTK